MYVCIFRYNSGTPGENSIKLGIREEKEEEGHDKHVTVHENLKNHPFPPLKAEFWY